MPWKYTPGLQRPPQDQKTLAIMHLLFLVYLVIVLFGLFTIASAFSGSGSTKIPHFMDDIYGEVVLLGIYGAFLLPILTPAIIAFTILRLLRGYPDAWKPWIYLALALEVGLIILMLRFFLVGTPTTSLQRI